MLLGNLAKFALELFILSAKFLLLLFRDSLWNTWPWRALVSLCSKSVEMPSTIKAGLFSCGSLLWWLMWIHLQDRPDCTTEHTESRKYRRAELCCMSLPGLWLQQAGFSAQQLQDAGTGQSYTLPKCPLLFSWTEMAFEIPEIWTSKPSNSVVKSSLLQKAWL